MSPGDVERFWAKVKKTERCWLWTGGKSRKGYGHFKLGGKHMRANRVAFELTNGPLAGKMALHSCDNPACVRPDHLFAGDDIVNRHDAMKKGRAIFFGRKVFV